MSSNKIIFKNTTGTDIGYKEFSIFIPASGQVEITPSEYPNLNNPEAITEMTADINSGDLVVNDGVNDLSASDGLRLISYNFRSYIQKDDVDVTRVNTVLNFEGDIFVTDDGNGKTTITVGETGTAAGKLFDFSFNNVGNTANKWLEFQSSSAASNDLPLVTPYNGSIIAFTFSNTNDGVDADIEIYKNAVLIYTWQVRNKKTAYKSNLPLGLDFVAGDRLSMFCRDAGANPFSPIIEIYASIGLTPSGEGGTIVGD